VTKRPRGAGGQRRRAVRSPARRRLPLALALTAVVVLAGGLGAVAFFGPGPRAFSGASTRVVAPAGGGMPGVARALARAGVIRSRLLFMVVAELTGAARHLQAGEYIFPDRASMAEVLAAIRSGAVVRYYITIPEGFTSAQAVRLLDRGDVLTGPASVPAEGALLPETYQVIRGETRAHVLGRMESARNALLAGLWAGRAAGLPYRSPEEAVIMASIVEKETALAGERPRITRVFLNRLAKGMRLESDPTVVYGLTGGDPLGHGLRQSELAKATAYNTYAVNGLPPTPIANPGRAALEAALHPAVGDDLYFVADGSGGHVFSASLAEHLKHVARWRAIEHASGSG